jgi:putative transposase
VDRSGAEAEAVIEACFNDLEPLVGTAAACRGSGKSRASHYRRLASPVLGPPRPRSTPANALSETECAELLAVLRSARFCDLAPAQVWAILLDEGTYLASISTMYRVLRGCGEVRERRAQAAHPARARPELMADRPNMCWTWDITKLRGPAKGVWFDCYVIIDIFSRYVVGWMVASTETAELAEEFITAALVAQGVEKGTLTIHADRGTSMTSKAVAELLADLGVGRTHSRPHVSNDNPYSEAVNKTLKYCPAFPARFGSIEDARAFCEIFFAYYNHDHRHSGIGLHTAASVHYGTATEIRAQRAETLDAAYAANPRRFCGRRPTPPRLPTIAWINNPTIQTDAQKNA